MGLESLTELMGVNIGSGTSANFWASSTFIMQFFLFTIGIGVAIFFLYRMFFYNIQVRVLKKVWDSFKVLDDKGRIKRRKDGTEVFELLRSKVRIPPPPNEYFMMGKKGKLNVELLCYGSSMYDYIPLSKQITESIRGMKLRPLPADTRNWAMVEIKRDAQKFSSKDFIEKYGVMISIGTIALLIIIVTWILMGTTKQAISASVEVARALQQTSQNLAGVQLV